MTRNVIVDNKIEVLVTERSAALAPSHTKVNVAIKEATSSLQNA